GSFSTGSASVQRCNRASVARRTVVASLLIAATLMVEQGAWAQARSIEALINDTVARVEQLQAKRHGKFALPEETMPPPIAGEELAAWAETATPLDPTPAVDLPVLRLAEAPALDKPS